MHRRPNNKAFTLAELLITLIVTGILLSALATLAFALSSATATESDVARMQSQFRHGTLRLQDVIRHCRLICALNGDGLAIWTADGNGDGRINVSELVYLEIGSDGDGLQLCWFSSIYDAQVAFSSGALSETKAALIDGNIEHYIPLIPDCQNVQLLLDSNPPLTRRVTVAFDLTEDGRVHHYQVDTTLRAWAGHLLDAAGTELVADDDE